MLDIICTIDSYRVAIPVKMVQEVGYCPPVTSVPLSEKPLCGLISLHGHIIPILDGAQRFHLGEGIRSDNPACVVLGTSPHLFAILVDDIEDMREIPDDSLIPVPPLLNDAAESIFECAHRGENHELTLLLNCEQLIQAETVMEQTPKEETK